MSAKNAKPDLLAEHITQVIKMSEYKCLYCKRVIDKEDVARRVRCVYCGSKILYKEKSNVAKKLKAR